VPRIPVRMLTLRRTIRDFPAPAAPF
jgi:hypothetical protein